MPVVKGLETVAEALTRMWAKYDSAMKNPSGAYERLLWVTGKVVDEAIQDETPAAADGALRAIVKLLEKAGCFRFRDFSSLAETIAIYRTYPAGPPPLTWLHYRFLVRIKDPAERALYEREAWYRGWSDPELAREIKAGLFSGFRAPPPQWRLDFSDRVVASSASSRCVCLILAPPAPPKSDDDSDEPPRECPVVVVDTVTGGRNELGMVRCSVLEGIGGSLGTDIAWIHDQLYIAAVDGLFRSVDETLEMLFPSDGQESACPPIDTPAGIASLWNAEDRRSFRVALWQAGACRWSEPMAGTAFSAVLNHSTIVVRINAYSAHSSQMTIELPTLRLTACGAVGNGSTLLSTGEQLFGADSIELRVAEDKELPLKHRGTSSGDLRIVRMSISGARRFGAVSCWDVTSPEKVRQWPLGTEDPPQALTALPEGYGLIVTCAKVVTAIVADRWQPIRLAEWSGQIVGEPVRVGTTLGWLVRRRDRPTTLGVKAPAGQHEYALELLDYPASRWAFLPFTLGEQLDAMYLCGERLIFVGQTACFGFVAEDLLRRKKPDSLRPGVQMLPHLGSRRTVDGLPLSGPVSSDWAEAVPVALAKELLPLDDFGAWQAMQDDSKRFAFWQTLVERELERVTRWPDYLAAMAEACPLSFLTLTSETDAESDSSAPFMSWTLDHEACRNALRWRQVREAAPSADDTDPEALRRARLLLYEYNRRCVGTRTLEEHLERRFERKGALNSLTYEARQALAWLTLGRYRSSFGERFFSLALRTEDLVKKPAIWAAVLWGVGAYLHRDQMRTVGFDAFMVTGGMFSAAFLGTLGLARLNRSYQSENGFLRFGQRWPHGCPPLLDDANAFVTFVQECVSADLLRFDARTPLQRAVANAWQHPRVNAGQFVFVSYSHKNEQMARAIVDGLRARGVGAVLDRNELDQKAATATVETWIAEGFMRSVTSIFLLSDEAMSSGWMHRESEWLVRMLGVRSSLVMPYLVTPQYLRGELKYPQSRIIHREDLAERPEEVFEVLRSRLVLDWLVTLRLKKERAQFGIAYQGKRPAIRIDIETAPEFTTLGDLTAQLTS